MKRKDLNRLGHLLLRKNTSLNINLTNALKDALKKDLKKSEIINLQKIIINGLEDSIKNIVLIMAAAERSDKRYTKSDMMNMSIFDIAKFLDVKIIEPSEPKLKKDDDNTDNIDIEKEVEVEEKDLPEEIKEFLKKLKKLNSVVSVETVKIKKETEK